MAIFVHAKFAYLDTSYPHLSYYSTRSGVQ